MIRPCRLNRNTFYFLSYLTLYKKSDIDNTVNYIHNDIKSYIKAIKDNRTAINDNITAMVVTLTDTTDNQNNLKNEIIELSSKISTYK